MEKIIEHIFGNPVYQAIAIILILILIYGIMKKIIKLVITIGAVLVCYSIYLNYTNQELPISKEELKKSVGDNVDKAKEKAKLTVDQGYTALKFDPIPGPFRSIISSNNISKKLLNLIASKIFFPEEKNTVLS